MFLAEGIALALAILFAVLIARPIRQLDQAIRRMGTADFTHAIDRFCIPCHDDVTHEQSGARGRPIRIYAHDQNATPAARRLRGMVRMRPPGAT